MCEFEREKAGRIRDLRMMTSDLRVGALGAIMHHHTLQTYSTFAVKTAEAQPGSGSPALPAQRRLRGIMQACLKV
jgi:hypothetical protein